MQACQLEQPTDIHEEEGKWGRLLLNDAQMKEMSEINELHPPTFSLSDFSIELTQKGYIESKGIPQFVASLIRKSDIKIKIKL
jgi:hypothetical protein